MHIFVLTDHMGTTSAHHSLCTSYQLGFTTRRFSNHESRLLSQVHTFAIIVILNFENTSKYVDTLILFSKT